jgi:hypothetical protein
MEVKGPAPLWFRGSGPIAALDSNEAKQAPI